MMKILGALAFFLGTTVYAAPAPATIQSDNDLLNCLKPFIPYLYFDLLKPSVTDDGGSNNIVDIAYDGDTTLTEKSSVILSINSLATTFSESLLTSLDNPAQTYSLQMDSLLCPSVPSLTIVRLSGFENIPDGIYSLSSTVKDQGGSTNFVISNLKVKKNITLTGNGADGTKALVNSNTEKSSEGGKFGPCTLSQTPMGFGPTFFLFLLLSMGSILILRSRASLNLKNMKTSHG